MINEFFFQIQSMICMDDQEFVANSNYVLSYLFLQCNQSSTFLYCFIILLFLISSFLHTRSLLILYVYVSIESIDCILLSSLALNAILLTFSVNTLCFSLPDLCCYFFAVTFADFLFCMIFLSFSKTINTNFIIFF